MIPKFVIPLLYSMSMYVVVVSTDDQEVETNAVKNDLLPNIATILVPEFTTNYKSDETVKIQLYYESLCPGCRNFVSSSFLNTVVELRANLDVQVYPFGNAWVQQNGSIGCQHGPTECYGNKLHACAIDYLDDIIVAVIFNGCMMEALQSDNGSDDKAAYYCGNRMGLDSVPIKLCAKGPKGEELLRYYGDESKKVHYEGVPTVLINGKPGNIEQFKSDVCNSFDLQPKPKPCRR